jgi:branched-chain amino acid transport system substrate-binding protein
MTKWYVMAANYNYGQISASWVKQFASTDGATLVGGSPKFYDLTDSDFSNVIPKIQSSGADLIVSLLVGAAQENFYKQWTATGLNKTTKIVSPTYGFGAEQITLGKAGTGILAAWPYMPTSNSDDAFAKAWASSGTKQPITPGAASTWNAWHLWAAAANKAGSTDRDKVIAALESGDVSYDSPAGTITMDGPTHQAVLPMKLWRDNGNGAFDAVTTLSDKSEPVFLQSKCDLIKDPTLNKQFTP